MGDGQQTGLSWEQQALLSGAELVVWLSFSVQEAWASIEKISIIPNADNKGTKQHTSVAGGRCFSCLSITSSIRFPIRDIRCSAPLKRQELKTMRRTSAANSSGLL